MVVVGASIRTSKAANEPADNPEDRFRRNGASGARSHSGIGVADVADCSSMEIINPATGALSTVGPTGLGDCSLPSSPCGSNSANSAALTPPIALEICQRTGSTAVVEGSIASLGSQYVLWLRARNCRTGDVIDEEQIQAARKEDVLSALSQLASRFRSRAGEGLTMVDKLDTPLAEATTPSLEALKAYSMGWKAVYASGSAAAVPFFKRAIEIDPQFAMAYAMRLGATRGT